MAQTKINPVEFLSAGSITRSLLNTATTGSAVATKIIAGTNITISNTGVDAGTGDVTINAAGGTYTGGTLTNAETLAANSTTVTPIKFQSGSLNTTPVAGAIEYDGNTFYATTNGSSNKRGALEVSYWCCNGSFTRASSSAYQQIFNQTTLGTITLQQGVYSFEILFQLTGLNTGSTNTVSFQFGGTATLSQVGLWVSGSSGAQFTPQGDFAMFYPGSNMVVVPTNTTGVATVYMRGMFEVSNGGTVIPQSKQSVAAATTVQAGSYAKFTNLGTGSGGGFGFQGNWT